MYWSIGRAPAIFRLRDCVGVRHLVSLLAEPGREFTAVCGTRARGRPRRPSPPGRSLAERARVNVARTIREAIRRIAEHDHAIDGHLGAAVRT